MIGGYLSLQGFDGVARWRNTAVEAAPPVTCLPLDDRVETPEGFSAVIDAPGHPILAGLTEAPWPVLLGLNETALKRAGTLLASAPAAQGGHPLLAVGEHGEGRSLAWMSDLGPHWAP
ncbi:Putative glutamine amidotransferase [Rubrimonas cliftonensis]|uniref:Putative glutamine amidotransferase n=1 Tax=Rubrimonas cliftonensis TaxID=89524 RepID=A0A1H4AJ58_9RHOB|nr:Putative glutamine amidotransferase [Rubrimonas cliftonensis]